MYLERFRADSKAKVKIVQRKCDLFNHIFIEFFFTFSSLEEEHYVSNVP